MLARMILVVLVFGASYLIVDCILNGWLFWLCVFTDFCQSQESTTTTTTDKDLETTISSNDNIQQMLLMRGVPVPKEAQTNATHLQLLLEASGKVGQDELDQLLSDVESGKHSLDDTTSKRYTSAINLVEDLESNLQLVLLIGPRTRVPNSWAQLARRLQRLGLSTATFDCARQSNHLCERFNWQSVTARLLLAIPSTTDHEPRLVQLEMFESDHTAQTSQMNILNWIQQHITNLIVNIEFGQVEHWIQDEDEIRRPLVKFVAILPEELKGSMPISLATLALRFQHSIQVGVTFVAQPELDKMTERYSQAPGAPIHLFAYNKRIFSFYSDGRLVNYGRTESFLQSLMLDPSDFIWTFFLLVNINTAFDIFWNSFRQQQRTQFRSETLRLILLTIIEMNISLLSAIIGISYTCSKLLIYADDFLPASTRYELQASTLWLGHMIAHVKMLVVTNGSNQLAVSILFTVGIINFLRQYLCPRLMVGDGDGIVWRKNLSLFHILATIGETINFVLFRTTRRHAGRRRHNETDGQHGQPTRDLNDNLIAEEDEEDEDEYFFDDDYIDLEQDLDRLLIERLFTLPNLWLQTELISSDYINNLPTWQYVAKRSEADTSQTEDFTSAISSSDCSDVEDGSETRWAPASVAAVSCSSKPERDPCCEFQAAGGSSKNHQEDKSVIVSKLSAKLEAKRRKLLRIRQEKEKRRLETRQRRRKVVATKEQDDDEEQGGKTNNCPPGWMLPVEECTICLDSYAGSEMIMGLACGHNYHRECIVAWLARGQHCCPICRHPAYRFRHPRQQQQQQHILQQQQQQQQLLKI